MEIDGRILIAVLTGEANAAERVVLDLWRAERPEHEAKYQRQSRMWALVGMLSGAGAGVSVGEGSSAEMSRPRPILDRLARILR